MRTGRQRARNVDKTIGAPPLVKRKRCRVPPSSKKIIFFLSSPAFSVVCFCSLRAQPNPVEFSRQPFLSLSPFASHSQLVVLLFRNICVDRQPAFQVGSSRVCVYVCVYEFKFGASISRNCQDEFLLSCVNTWSYQVCVHVCVCVCVCVSMASTQ